jgi:hypothetical protein
MAGIIVGAKIYGEEFLEAKLQAAFETWVKEDIDDAYWADQFQDMSKWKYGRETKRKNREIVDSPRDIYDLGTLYESGKNSTINAEGNMVTASWNWDAEGGKGYKYARDVHEGEGTSSGFPRKWTDELYFPQKFEGSTVRLAFLRRLKAAFPRRRGGRRK